MYEVKIKNLRLKAIIGINPEEREHKQELSLNYSIKYSAQEASKTDKIDDTFNYKKLNKEIIKIVEESEFFLIERLVTKIIEHISSYPEIEYSSVELSKLGAIRYADCVSITKEFSRTYKNKNTYILSLGSNIEPQKNMQKAKEKIRTHFKVLHEAEVIQTKALGDDTQDNYLNTIIEIESDKNISELKKITNAIEVEMGRVKDPNNKNAPRVIDIDIIGMNSMIIDVDYYEKPFIKKLVNSILPDIVN